MRITMRTIDFRPAPTGWRIVWLSALEAGYSTSPLPGWLIQEEVARDELTDHPLDTPDERDRYVMPAFLRDGFVPESVEGIPEFWYVIGPGEPPPTDEEVAAERAARAHRAQSKASHRALSEVSVCPKEIQ